MRPEDLAAFGFYLFPCRGKRPLVKWLSLSTTDIPTIRRWARQYPKCNWGVDCGKSGLVVLDDDRGKNPKAIVSLEALEHTYGPLPCTFIVATPSKGFHLYYRGQGRNSASSRLGKGLDSRGVGGYVIAPCSPGYTIVQDSHIAEAPAWLIDLLGEPTERDPQEVPAGVTLDSAANVARAIEYLKNIEPAIEGDGGDTHTYKTACRVRDFGISHDTCQELMEEHFNARCIPPWDIDALAEKVFNAYRYAEHPIASEAPEVVFNAFDAIETDLLFIDAADLINQDIVVNYLVQDLIETPTTGLIFGDPGSMKSFLALDLALCVATGTDWMGQKVQRGQVFYFVGEGKAGIPRRIKAWLKHHETNLERGWLHTTTKRIEISSRSARTLVKDIGALAEKNGQPALIIVDTLARHLPADADENSAKDFGQFINVIDSMRDKFNCVALIIHHSGKQNKDSSRGTSAIKGALDFEYKTDGFQLECKKQKEGEEPPPLLFHLQSIALSEKVSSAVVIYDGRGQHYNPTKKLSGRFAGAFSCLEMLISENGGRPVSRELWRTAFYEQLGDDVKLSAKKGTFRRVEEKLLLSGTIRIVNGLIDINGINGGDSDG